jgi:hypothetical protein
MPERRTIRDVGCVVLSMAVAWGGAAGAMEVDLRGQAAASFVSSDAEARVLRADFRYQPDLTITLPTSGTTDLTGFVAGEALFRSSIRSLDTIEGEGEISLYRAWVRYAGSRAEIRLGRQKLSFGSATLLRPLMWFDSIDPRDPLQLTEGVDGLLVRSFFANNANVWLWGLLGNEDPRGWELFPTVADEAEYGGRLQWPLGNGEVAATYHHRLADLPLPAVPLPGNPDPRTPENRFALDGKWDLTVGVWFEAVLVRQENDLLPRPWRRIAVAGIDYTFGIGQGLTVLAEHLVAGESEDPFGAGDLIDYGALSLRYPWGVVDEFGLIVNYDWDNADWYNFLEWRRTYDRWSFHLMGFANPAEGGAAPLMQGSGLLSGTGGRLLVAFNH